MTLDPKSLSWMLGIGVVTTLMLIAAAFADDVSIDLKRRLGRVSTQGSVRKITTNDRQRAVRDRRDSGIPLLDMIVKFLPNPDKLRRRLARTGKKFSLGEYLLINLLVTVVVYLIFHTIGWSPFIAAMIALMLGLLIPHMVIGFMGARRIKHFLASFPESIDTMTRGIRSGLPITESIGSVGREMPDPIGIEFRRIADGVRLGKTLESAMWEVNTRVDTAEFRFLIIAMAIQKETGGNLAETLGNLSELIRRRRQLRLKIKAMSSEAKASAMIIGSLPFVMFILLLIVNRDYPLTLFQSTGGKITMACGLTWMGIGWGAMIKMISFDF